MLADPLADGGGFQAGREGELGNVGRAARAVALPEIVPWRQRLAAAADDLQKNVRKRSAFSRQRVVHSSKDVVQLDLLNVLRGVDPEAGDAEVRERQQVVGDLLTHRGESGVQVGQREQL